ncbi:MAG: F0F1 ATP synthase subunit delta [Candidatus Yonathbacteria bacterium]|nr:F0F1 ATP synthase subunit delta [Candidatus Yonathbacteria bacterium]
MPTTRHYAEALFAVMSDCPDSERMSVLDAYVAVLSEDRMIDKSDDILARYGELRDNVEGVVVADVVSALPLSENSRDAVVRYVKRRTNASDICIRESLDSALLGGLRLRYRDRIVDATVSGRITEIHRALRD